MSKPLFPDDLWAIVAPLLPPEPPRPTGGRPRVPDRAALTGILFVLRSGIPWEMLPQEMGCGSGVLTCTASVIPGQSNTIKLAIADRGDSSLDSNVFIRASSFVVVPPTDPDPDPDPGTPPDPGTEKPPVQPVTLSTGGTTGSTMVTGLPSTGAGETESATGSAFLILTLISGTLVMLALSRVIGHRAHAQ